MSIFRKKAEKKMYFERKLKNFVYVNMDLNVSKTKPVAPRGHPLLLLLFFQNKSCMHYEVRTCTEILTGSILYMRSCVMKIKAHGVATWCALI